MSFSVIPLKYMTIVCKDTIIPKPRKLDMRCIVMNFFLFTDNQELQKLQIGCSQKFQECTSQTLITNYFRATRFYSCKAGNGTKTIVSFSLQNSRKSFLKFSWKWDICTNIPESPTYREIRTTGTFGKWACFSSPLNVPLIGSKLYVSS